MQQRVEEAIRQSQATNDLELQMQQRRAQGLEGTGRVAPLYPAPEPEHPLTFLLRKLFE
jgi:hypothetical protein